MEEINEKKGKSIGGKIFNILTWIILIVLLGFALVFYRQNNFNEFIRSESTLHVSEFKRDNDEKYSNVPSYRITSSEWNDATFYKKIKLKENMPYKVSCMVKTDNIIPENNNGGIGAQISIIGTTEKSVAVTGTNEWQKIEMIFNSKNRTEIDIGFRLGGYLGKAKGKAWFSDFKIEEGTKNDSDNWKFACFIFENTDVKIDGKEVNVSVTNTDIEDVRDTIRRFQTTVKTLSQNKMTAECDAYIVQDPITKLTYDDEFGYFVAAEDIEDSIKDIVTKRDYDHIFAIIRLGNEQHADDIEINDWIGLRFYGLLWYRIFKYKITKFFKKLFI